VAVLLLDNSRIFFWKAEYYFRSPVSCTATCFFRYHTKLLTGCAQANKFSRTRNCQEKNFPTLDGSEQGFFLAFKCQTAPKRKSLTKGMKIQDKNLDKNAKRQLRIIKMKPNLD
jgi:hypothetical protein